ncbi:hypothetical protein [Arenivirga flava]|uniref:Uncharacterized protein n=1 Tax=Arenivirga flava TaxID=1930060 RepID=A0AA37UKH2_9MICO|nr:hypothetical protein [Arenivirga flava]GMA26901.1 hypothetical protein GCM10025874_01540 [Arenivirga flava]
MPEWNHFHSTQRNEDAMNGSTRRRTAIGSIIGTWVLGATIFAVLLLLHGPTPPVVIAMSTGTAALVAATTAGAIALRGERVAR